MTLRYTGDGTQYIAGLPPRDIPDDEKGEYSKELLDFAKKTKLYKTDAMLAYEEKRQAKKEAREADKDRAEEAEEVEENDENSTASSEDAGGENAANPTEGES